MLTAFALVVASALPAAVKIEAGKPYRRNKAEKEPMSLSGIAWSGKDDLYYAVADNDDVRANELGLHRLWITLSKDGLSVKNWKALDVMATIRLEGVKDVEGCAVDPFTGKVWVVDEANTEIGEYDPETAKPRRFLSVSKRFRRHTINYGLESLTISPDGLVLWTANEEALPVDGNRSSPVDGTMVRLVKYTRKSVRGTFAPAGEYAYKTEKWHNEHSCGRKGRRGVADLCALPDGSLLVLERELSFSHDGTGLLGKASGMFYWEIFRVEKPEGATDVRRLDSLLGTKYKPVRKTSLISDYGSVVMHAPNYEGLALGPELGPGKRSLLLVSDAGDGYTGAYLLPLVIEISDK